MKWMIPFVRWASLLTEEWTEQGRVDVVDHFRRIGTFWTKRFHFSKTLISAYDIRYFIEGKSSRVGYSDPYPGLDFFFFKFKQKLVQLVHRYMTDTLRWKIEIEISYLKLIGDFVDIEAPPITVNATKSSPQATTLLTGHVDRAETRQSTTQSRFEHGSFETRSQSRVVSGDKRHCYVLKTA